MKRITPSLIAILCLFAAPLLAEVSPQPVLEYAQYTLSTQSFKTLDTAPANGVEAWNLNTADTILFVRDTTKTDASYYIAVFELTRAQAKALGWTTEDDPSMIAFGDVNSSKALPAPLFYPTPDQWKAYVEEKPTRRCNLSFGRSVASEAVLSLESWMLDFLANGDSAKNAYGLYDTFGNVAEGTIDAEGNLTFQGWYAETSVAFDQITRDNAGTTLTEIQANKGKIDNAVAGVRPIYVPPENQTYTVTVTLDGRTLETFTQTGLEPDETITVNNLPPTPNEGYRLNLEPVVSPADLAIQFNEGSATFTMPMDHVTLAYTSSAQATLTVNGGTADKEMVCPQEPFTLTADPTRTFLKWEGTGITDENATQNPLTLTLAEVPAGGTLTYTAVFDPAITIKVIGGTAVPSKALKGETVTITATQNAWQTFSHWEDGHRITSNNAKTNPLTITLGENLADGAQLTYTAVFNSRPRVLVFGGTATAKYSADDHGNGYYETGAELSLTPYDDCPEGYLFSHWQTANGDKLSEATYTVGKNNTTETLTAVYEADDTIANADPIYIGVVSETDDVKKTRTGFGYLANEPKDLSYENKKNPIHYYGTTEPTSDYAQLVFDPKAIDYSTVTADTANTAENRKTALVMKRIKPENGEPYYVGIHEVTHAQYLGIHSATDTKYTLLHGTLPNNSIEDAKESLLPHATTGQSRYEANTFLTLLGKHYGETFSKPTQAQIAGITAKYGDKEITAAMVNSNKDKLQDSGSKTEDPYGFYDLFGNAAEDLKDGDGWLWCGYYSTAFTDCTLKETIESNFGAFLNGAIRPAIEVKPRHTIKLLNLPEADQSMQVIAGQTITLKPQVKPGCQFKGWQVNGEPYTTLETPLTITADTTLEATFSEALTAFDVTYGEDIIGPATAFPGTTINVYTADPTVTLETLSVTPADAVTLNPDKTITFSDAIRGPVTITLTSPEAKPGFHFYVR